MMPNAARSSEGGPSALQAPVGYDEHSFGYRDLEGSKVHKALREEYGRAYKEGDVIGCYIHMPEGGRRLEKSKAVSPLLPHVHCSCKSAVHAAA